MHITVAALVATGLGNLTASRKGFIPATLGWLIALSLAGLSAVGNYGLLQSSDDWIKGIDELCAQADLVVVVPQGAQKPVHAMLFGDAPESSETVRFPPVCKLGTEPFCRRVGRLRTVSVDEVTDEVAAMTATFSHSVWVFSRHPEMMNGGRLVDVPISTRMAACQNVYTNSMWSVYHCDEPVWQPRAS